MHILFVVLSNIAICFMITKTSHYYVYSGWRGCIIWVFGIRFETSGVIWSFGFSSQRHSTRLGVSDPGMLEA